LNAAKVQVRIPIFGSSSGSGITHSRLARSLLVGRNDKRRGLPGSGRLRALTTDSQDTANNNNALLETPLPEHPDLYRGTLKSNGLHYVVLPNKVPPHRFEAHLEMHVGSVDENERQQGLAHLVEHVTFLGSRKREGLLGTGTRSNAYTDFHHTVFHVHAPNTNSSNGKAMLPQVLGALREIAFEPELLPSRLEKERRAVLAEMQMMNTIDYRVDVQLLTYLHEENALGCRFPIGLEEQIKNWSREDLVEFHEKWYFPANATLYVVGDFDSTEEVEELIEKSFGDLPARLVEDGDEEGKKLVGEVLAKRHVVRPPVKHTYGNLDKDAKAYAPVEEVAGEEEELEKKKNEENNRSISSSTGSNLTVKPSIFRHPLLHEFSINMFCKLPVMRVRNLNDLKRSFIGRIVLSVLKFRLNSHFASDEELKITSFDLDFSDSGREGCTVTTLTVTAEPRHWKEAVQLAVNEVRRMKEFGVTKSEYKHYCEALLRDSRQLSEQAGTVPSIDNLDFVMESDALGHIVMDQKQSHVALESIVPTIELEEVNAYARSILSYISNFGLEEEMVIESNSNFAKDMGPTRATSIVTCIPAYVDKDGESLGGGGPQEKGQNSLGQMDHEQLQAILESGEPVPVPEDDLSGVDIPDNAVDFNLDSSEIAQAITEVQSLPLVPVEDFEVPDHLIPDEVLDGLAKDLAPHFVPLEGQQEVKSAPDMVTGIVQKRLSNGIAVNYCRTDNEPQAAMIRVVASGGRGIEKAEAAANGLGSVALGTRALSEVGAIGQWERQQVELFCVSNLIHFVLETTEEFVVLDFHFASTGGGIRSVMEMIHLLLQSPRWDEPSLVRAKQAYRAHYSSLGKSLERVTLNNALTAMVGQSCCFLDPVPEEIDAVTLNGAAEVLMAQMVSQNLEINVVGDFDEKELDSTILRLLGTLPDRSMDWSKWVDHSIDFVRGSLQQNNTKFLLADSDERACAYIIGPAPYRWQDISGSSSASDFVDGGAKKGGASSFMDFLADGAKERQKHPLFMSVSLSLMAEIINSRLFTTVRDSLGLTYDVSFELQLLDRIQRSWYSVSVTSTPAKIDDALDASMHVLRELTTRRVSQQELDRARRTLLARHETDLKDNSYLIGLLTHLQCKTVPRKDLVCLQDLSDVYNAATVADIYEAYNRLGLSDQEIYTCTGVSGKDIPNERGMLEGEDPSQKQQLEAAAAIAQASQNGNLFEAIRIALERQQGGSS
jgi:predicted Zn-dependent peptidase